MHYDLLVWGSKSYFFRYKKLPKINQVNSVTKVTINTVNANTVNTWKKNTESRVVAENSVNVTIIYKAVHRLSDTFIGTFWINI